MKAFFTKYSEMPNWVFLAAIAINILTPEKTKDYALTLLLLAFADSALRPRTGEKSKYGVAVSFILQALWIVGFFWSFF